MRAAMLLLLLLLLLLLPAGGGVAAAATPACGHFPAPSLAEGTRGRTIDISLGDVPGAQRVNAHGVRGYNIQIQGVAANAALNTTLAIDAVASASESPSTERFAGEDPYGGRRVQFRVWWKYYNWPTTIDDASVRRTLTAQYVQELAQQGHDVLVVMFGCPAAFSSACDEADCAGKFKSCNCNSPDFHYFLPRAQTNNTQNFTAAWWDYQRWIFGVFADLGATGFELYNEPDMQGHFRGMWGYPSTEDESTFFRYTEMLFDAWTIARSSLNASAQAAIKIGGPAMARWDGMLTAAQGPEPSLFRFLDAFNASGRRLDFVSYHMYTQDAAQPAAWMPLTALGAHVPAAWGVLPHSVNEWAPMLLGHNSGEVCPGPPAPVSGDDRSVGCDHRGAGKLVVHQLAFYAAMREAGAAGAIEPYFFDVLEDPAGNPLDFVTTGMGLVTTHAFPKAMGVAAHFLASMRGRLAEFHFEWDTDATFAALASYDDRGNGTVRVILAQYDSAAQLHLERMFLRETGGVPFLEVMGPACGCVQTNQPAEAACLRQLVEDALASGLAVVESRCPGLSSTELDAVNASLAAAERRLGLENTTLDVAIGLRDFAHPVGAAAGAPALDARIWTIGPGASPFDLYWQLGELPLNASAAEIRARFDVLWNASVETPGAVVAALPAGESLPVLTVPAYGVVFIELVPSAADCVSSDASSSSVAASGAESALCVPLLLS